MSTYPKRSWTVFACTAVALALFPVASYSWMAAGGGVAARSWSFGIPGSPLLVASQSGAGAFDAVRWSEWSLSLDVFSVSSVLLIAVALPAIVAWKRKRPASRQDRLQ